jgi:hypothetical protein
VNTHSENLQRVKSRIAPAVIEFARARVGGRFTMRELVEYVAGVVGVAPDSPSRILRDLRQSGELDYVVLSRRDSVYFVASVAG